MNPPKDPARWHVCERHDAALDLVLELVVRRLSAVHEPRTVVLAGGSTPLPLYQRLAPTLPNASLLAFVPSDERCAAPGDPERNDAVLWRTFLRRLPVPPLAFVALPGELGPEAGAAAAEPLIAGLPPLELALLGVGEDGHTASLFPDNPALRAAGAVAGVRGAPKPPPERLTLTCTYLSSARTVIFLATGESKRAALAAWRDGVSLPAAMVRGCEETFLIADRAAAGS